MVLCGIYHNFNEASLWLPIATVNLLACLCYCVAIVLNHFLTWFFSLSFFVVAHEKIIHPSTWICGSFFIVGFICLRLARMLFCRLTFTMRSSTHTLLHASTQATANICTKYRIVHIGLNIYEICKCVRWFVRWLHDLFFRRFFHFIFSDSHFLSIPSLWAIHVRLWSGVRSTVLFVYYERNTAWRFSTMRM